MISIDNIREKLQGKGKKIILILGIAGIILIYLSSLTPKSTRKSEVNTEEASAQYCALLESKVSELVTGITGSKKVSVAITLDTGSQFVYADEGRETKTENTDDRQQSYTIIKSSDGEESGLLVTEYMPTVRGVAIVCDILGADTEEKVRAAVMAALDIQNKKIYVTGYAY